MPSPKGACSAWPLRRSFAVGAICYDGCMTKDQVKEVLDRVLTWPPERQADVVHMVELMEEQDRSDLQLSDEQAAEVRRRLADPSRKTIPAEEVFRRYRETDQ